MIKVLVTIGTRPEAIKMAPVVKELQNRSRDFGVAVCLTAQHREMLDQVIDLFKIPVSYDLNLMKPNQDLSDLTSRVLLGMGRVIEDFKPDLLLVQGDTTTILASTLASYYKKIRVGHVEAGLRTYDKFRPFPEEMNRRLCDALCDYHYAPTPRARESLLKENISPEHIVVTGNTVIDALIDIASRSYEFTDPLLERVGRHRKLLLVTAHRRESFGEQLRHMCMAVRDIVFRNLDVEAIFPVHPNTNVRQAVDQVLMGVDRVYLVPPQEYQAMVNLLKKATIVLTDSGGIQEEAPSLGKPVLVMRDETERPEGIEAGAALLVGTSYAGIVEGTQRILDDPEAYARMANKVSPYGDGLASKRIADHIASVNV